MRSIEHLMGPTSRTSSHAEQSIYTLFHTPHTDIDSLPILEPSIDSAQIRDTFSTELSNFDGTSSEYGRNTKLAKRKEILD